MAPGNSKDRLMLLQGRDLIGYILSTAPTEYIFEQTISATRANISERCFIKVFVTFHLQSDTA